MPMSVVCLDCVCSAQEFLTSSASRLSPRLNDSEEASLQSMLQGKGELQLSSHVSRWFFGRFHQAHVHLYELDVPVDAEQAVKSSGSVASHALQDLQTGAAGLYVAFNSDTGLLAEDSAVMHEKPQSKQPRILLASLDHRQGEERRARYAPLIPLPATLLASDLHPWNTAMHSIKIPFVLLDSLTTADTDTQAVNALVYLQPRYSQYSRCDMYTALERRQMRW